MPHAAIFVLVLLALSLSTPARANDGYAEMAAGGLVLSRTDAIRMEREDLYVSRNEIRVDYVFRNITNRPIEAHVLFPLPDIPEGAAFSFPPVTGDDPVNFVGFTVTVEGRAITPNADVRAVVKGAAVNDVLARHGLAPNPLAEGLVARLTALPRDALDDLAARELVDRSAPDVQPLWGLKVSYHWTQTFPASAELRVAHRYRPVLGRQFMQRRHFQEPDFARAYCPDAAFEAALRQRLPDDDSGVFPLALGYILTTANSWATPIGRFRLVVDKGEPDTLISLCAPGIRRLSPTTFEWVRENFHPADELRIVFLPSNI